MAGDTFIPIQSATPEHINSLLYARYGDAGWWPASSVYEVMAGAVLTQNTNWSNVEKAIAGFGGRLSPELVAGMDIGELIEIIRPAGFFNQKAVYLKALTAWYARYGFEPERVRARVQTELRAELLSVRGVGRETADSVLLYAFGFPEFVADAYTARLLERLGQPAKGYENVKAWFTAGLPRDTGLYNNLHAMIVLNGKEHCRKAPKCPGCPLCGVCAFYRNL